MSDDEQNDPTFEGASAGSSLTYPMQASALKKDGHAVIKGSPCKIVGISTSGGSGQAMVHIIGVDVFTGKRLEDTRSDTENVDVPKVLRSEYQLGNIDDGCLNLMTPEGTAKDDVLVPEGELGVMLTDEFGKGTDLYVTIFSAMGRELAVSFKESPKLS